MVVMVSIDTNLGVYTTRYTTIITATDTTIISWSRYDNYYGY